MSVKGRRAERTLDARSAALKVPPATGVGVGLGGEPQLRAGTLSGFDLLRRHAPQKGGLVMSRDIRIALLGAIAGVMAASLYLWAAYSLF